MSPPSFVANFSSSSPNKENFNSSSSSSVISSSPPPASRPVLTKRRSVEFSDTLYLSSSPPQFLLHQEKRPIVALPRRALDYDTPSSSDSSSSAFCPTPAPKRKKSILKSSAHPIQLAKSLGEGTRANSGPRKHSLYLPDLCDTMSEAALRISIGDHTSLQELLASPLSALKAALAPPPAVAATTTTSSSTVVPVEPRDVEYAYTQLMDRLRAWCLRGTSDQVATAKAALSSDADRAAAAQAVHIIAESLIRDLDPSLWEQQPPQEKSPSSPSPDWLDTEHKRLHLMSPNRPLTTAPSSPSPLATAAPQTTSSSKLSLSATHLQPGHVGSSSPLMSTPKFAHLTPHGSSASKQQFHQQQQQSGCSAQRQGKTELEIQRKRVQIDVAQAGIKCLAVILHHVCYYSFLSETQLDKLLMYSLKIPHAASLRLPKDRDIVAFSVWLFRAQALPSITLRPYMPAIVASVKACFTSSKPNSDKPRRAVMEALSTIHHLALTYPDTFACRAVNDEELRLAIMSSCVRDPFTIRARGCMALGGLFLSLQRPWPQVDEGEEEDEASESSQAEEKERTRHMAKDLFGHYLCAFFQEDDSRHLRTLERLLDSAKAHPDQHLWMVHILAMLPAIMGHRFRKLEQQGPQVWMRYMTFCIGHPNKELVGLAYLNWDHFVYAWMEASVAYKSRDFVWGLNDKPMQLLTQIIERQQVDTSNVARSNGINGRQKLHFLKTLLYGFSGHISTHFNNAGRDRLVAVKQYSALWRAVEPHLSSMLNKEPMPEDVVCAAQQCFAAILACRRHDRLMQRWSPDRILSADILAGWAATATNLETAGAVVESEWLKGVKSEEIPPFATEWIVENLDKCLDMLSLCMTASLHQTQSQATGEPVLPQCPDVLKAIFASLVAAQAGYTSDAGVRANERTKAWLLQQATTSSSVGLGWLSDIVEATLTWLASWKQGLTGLWSTLTSMGAELRLAKGLIYLDAAVPLRSADIFFANDLLCDIPETQPPQKRFLTQFCSLWGRLLEQDHGFGQEQGAEQSSALLLAMERFFRKVLPSWMALEDLTPLLTIASRCSSATASGVLDVVARCVAGTSTENASTLLEFANADLCLPQGVLDLVSNEIPASPKTMESLSKYLANCPRSRFVSALSQVQDSVVSFLRNASHFVGNDERAVADEIYMRLLAALSEALQGCDLLQQDLDRWQDVLLAPWTEHPSPMCSVAFSELWRETFQKQSQTLHLSDDMRAVLHLLELSEGNKATSYSLEDALEQSLPQSADQPDEPPLSPVRPSSRTHTEPPRQTQHRAPETKHITIDLYSGDDSDEEVASSLLSSQSQRRRATPSGPSSTKRRTPGSGAEDSPGSVPSSKKRRRSSEFHQVTSAADTSGGHKVDPKAAAGHKSDGCPSPAQARNEVKGRETPLVKSRRLISQSSSFECVEVPLREDVPLSSSSRKISLKRLKALSAHRGLVQQSRRRKDSQVKPGLTLSGRSLSERELGSASHVSPPPPPSSKPLLVLPPRAGEQSVGSKSAGSGRRRV